MVPNAASPFPVHPLSADCVPSLVSTRSDRPILFTIPPAYRALITLLVAIGSLLPLLLAAPASAQPTSTDGMEARMLHFRSNSGELVRSRELPDPALVFLHDRVVDLRRQAEKAELPAPSTVAPWVLAFEGAPDSKQRLSL